MSRNLKYLTQLLYCIIIIYIDDVFDDAPDIYE